MKTSADYLELSERIAKLTAKDAATREQLDALERSYFLLAKSAQVLARSKRLQEVLERKSKAAPVGGTRP